MGRAWLPTLTPQQHFFKRSDNYSLARRGIIAQTVSSFGLHADYHQPSDEISRIDFPHMTRAIGSMVGPDRVACPDCVEAAMASHGKPCKRIGYPMRFLYGRALSFVYGSRRYLLSQPIQDAHRNGEFVLRHAAKRVRR